VLTTKETIVNIHTVGLCIIKHAR